jgi:Glycosyltransferase family 28 N-terminal domain
MSSPQTSTETPNTDNASVLDLRQSNSDDVLNIEANTPVTETTSATQNGNAVICADPSPARTETLIKRPTFVPLVRRRKSPPRMHILMLTIGSRGDVQPFISLCMGFKKHGHTCTIATHYEYKDWIEGFGIGFRELKGNPAELYIHLTQYAVMCKIRHVHAFIYLQRYKEFQGLDQ